MKAAPSGDPGSDVADTAEGRRLAQIDDGIDWRRWGPYLSERQWGTVREDYSADGNAWDHFPHAHARSRAYRWGEDGIGGFSDDQQRLCVAAAFWNGRDAILKERLFGLDNAQGNHGEDVKELYYFVDGVPSHAYMRMLYEYPQAAFPYDTLIAENAARGLDDPEYEILETGVFDDGRYFDIEIEHAKAGPDDVLMRVTAHNRGPDVARLHMVPQLWARNTWSWNGTGTRARLVAARGANSANDANDRIDVAIDGLPPMHASFGGRPSLLFCENDTNTPRLYGTTARGPFKDGIHDCIVDGSTDAVNPLRQGSKAAAHYVFDIAAGGSATVRVRVRAADGLADGGRDCGGDAAFDRIVDARREEADAFYGVLQQDIAADDARLVQRQAFAGLLWAKQYYGYDVRRWLQGDAAMPPPPDGRGRVRNGGWRHLCAHTVSRIVPTRQR